MEGSPIVQVGKGPVFSMQNHKASYSCGLEPCLGHIWVNQTNQTVLGMVRW